MPKLDDGMQLLAVRLRKSPQVGGDKERPESCRHLLARHFSWQRRVNRLDFQENRNRALCILR